MSLPMQTFQ